MSVMVATKVKDGSVWLPRFINQIEHLEGDISRVVCMYGVSRDNSYALLKHWQRMSHLKIEVYAEPYLPETERSNATLARVKRDIQTLLKNGDEDYYLHLDCDLVIIPATLIPRLMKREKDVIAAMVWVEGRRIKTFFDTYMFRSQGCKFHPYTPPGLGETEPLAVDSVGTGSLYTREAELAGIYRNPYPNINFCQSLKEKGYQVWIDPTVDIYHIDLERLGILHPPMEHPYSNVPFITNRGEKLQVEQVMGQAFHVGRTEYDMRLEEQKPREAAEIKEWLNKRPLITASYKVFNEMQFLPYSLKSVYPYVDRIDVVEGASQYTFSYSDATGASTDGTIEFLKNYPDPEHKIRVVQGKWESKEHMQAKLLELCDSKWMLFIDGDEVLDAKSMRNLREWSLKHQDGKIVYARPARFYNFWHDFKHIAYSLNPLSAWAQYGLPHAFLIWRDIPGLNFTHYHTIPMDGFAIPVTLDHPSYRKKQAVLDDVFVYHFGNAKGADAMRYKLTQMDSRMLGSDGKEDPWFTGVMPDDMVLERFKGKMPRILRSHPEYGKRHIRITETEPLYRFEILP